MKREKFCHLVAEGMSAAESYRQAGYKIDRMTDEMIHSEAFKIRHHPDVEARIEELQQATAERHDITTDWLVEMLKTVAQDASNANQHAAASQAYMNIARITGNVVERRESKVQTLDLAEMKPDFASALDDEPETGAAGNGASDPAKHKPKLPN